MPPVNPGNPGIHINKLQSHLQDNSNQPKQTHASLDNSVHQQAQHAHPSPIYPYADSQDHSHQSLPNPYVDQPHVDITHPVPIIPYSSQPPGISGSQHHAESSHISTATADSIFTSSHTTPPINDTKVNVMDMSSNYHHVHTREGFFKGDSFHPSHGPQQTQIYEEAEMRNDPAQSHHGLVGHGHGDIMLGGHGYRTYEKFDGQTGYTAVEGYSQSRQVHQAYQFHHDPSHLHPHVLPATRDGHTLETGHSDYHYQHHTEELQERKELQGQYVLQYDGTHVFTPYSN